MTRHDTMPKPLHAGAHDDRLRWAMDASGMGIAIVDLHGRWLEVNPAFECMLGYRGEELVGRATSALIHPDDVAISERVVARLLEGGLPAVDAETRYLHRDGSVVWVQTNLGVMRDARGEPRNLLLQMRDITAQRVVDTEAQNSADRRAHALDASHRQLQLFADAVAHDLRAPLRSIDSFAGLLAGRAEGRLDETDRDYLRRIRAAAERMGGLLSALGELSGATRAEIKPTAVDMSLLAEWTCAELQDANPERRAEIVVQPGLFAWGDEHLLKQMLTQLMGNAWTFSRARDVTRIEVSGERSGNRLRLSVHDEGIGFDTRYAHKLFEPFQRLHGSEQGGGHGLGLAIAQRIAERHGGHITADSRPDAGATFIVDLPAVAAVEDPPHA